MGEGETTLLMERFISIRKWEYIVGRRHWNMGTLAGTKCLTPCGCHHQKLGGQDRNHLGSI